MISQAKANVSAVKAFEQSASAAKDYSSKLKKGIECLEMLLSMLIKTETALNEAISETAEAIDDLFAKITRIEQQISSLTVQLENLESHLENLEIKLEHTQENGDYPGEAAVSDKISAVECEISSVQAELSPLEERLNRAYEVYSRLVSHADAMNGVAYSLSEKASTCRHLRDELETIRQKNLSQGASAVETLKKLQNVIAEYLQIRMEYEEMSFIPLEMNNKGEDHSNINISVNIHESSSVQMKSVEEKVYISREQNDKQEEQKTRRPVISEQEIKEHNVSLDEFGRIAIYDGKSFGGKYNSYETRWQRTSVDDNPMLGYYEGERGESKFIPSSRTAEGIIINEILENYGLDGITYRNAEPDFETCAEAVVTITDMTENRENCYSDDGTFVMGNFSQADIQLAEKWNIEKREDRNDWQPRDVYDYRKANRLTWHEKCDTKTMVLVRFEINMFFRHSGGCSECRTRDSITDNGGGFDE